MSSLRLIYLIVGILWASKAYGQINDVQSGLPNDTIPGINSIIPKDTLNEASDTIPVPNSGPTDIRDNTTSSQPQQIKIADSELRERIIYGSIDSQRLDRNTKLIYLHGDAFVKYADKELYADLIILDVENKVAEARKSPYKRYSKRPKFVEAGKEYLYNGLRYNFETERGIVLGATVVEGEFHIESERAKYVTNAEEAYGDSDIAYNLNSLLTTCNHPEHKHFGFRTKKLKVVSDRVAVAGPSKLEIAGIPTPLWIPFLVYPLTSAASSGLIFPSGYRFYDRELGFGIQGIGWYFPINDYVHTQVTGDFFTRGSLALYSSTSYNRRYKYTGGVNLSYTRNRREQIMDNVRGLFPTNSFSLRINHRQDAKAHPYRTLDGNIRIVGNDNERRNNLDAQSNLTTQYTSQFNFSHTMPRTPFSFGMGMSHDQNTNTGVMNITLPTISLRMRTINPFENNNRATGKPKWYENITLGYSSNLRVRTTTTDTTLFTNETIENIRSGMQHYVTVFMPTKFLQYFSFSPSASYEETWVLNTIENSIVQSEPFIPMTPEDSLQFSIDGLFQTVDSLVTNNLQNGGTYRTIRAGFDIDTQIFGTMNFKKGKIRGVRHLMKPRIGWSYSPNQLDKVDTIIFDDGRERELTFTRFDDGPFGSPRFSGLQSQINYNVENSLELKLFSKKDSSIRKFKVFDRVNVSGNYNFAADSLKFSTHVLNSTSRFLGGIVTLTSRWTFDPYLESNGRRVNQTVWADRKKIARLDNGTINMSTRFTFGNLREWFTKSEDERAQNDFANSGFETGIEDFASSGGFADNQINPNLLTEEGLLDEDERREREKQREPVVKKKSIFDLLDNIAIRHEIVYGFTSDNNQLSSGLTTHSLSLTGRFDITNNWYINVGNIGYDFVQRGPTFSVVSFGRKLHCWDMNITWTPVGRANSSFTFSIGVASSNLGFLKYDYGQNPLTNFSAPGF